MTQKGKNCHLTQVKKAAQQQRDKQITKNFNLERDRISAAREITIQNSF